MSKLWALGPVTDYRLYAVSKVGYAGFSRHKSSLTTLGIRKESKGRWERRAALAPEHVKRLTDQGIRVLVQPSSLRVFGDQEYQKVGAEITEDMSEPGTILGVKEVPIDMLLEGKTYLFFSHTHKAQPYNMKMLDAILKNKIRLIDYEKMATETGERIVMFGRFAGLAGMAKLINGLGNRLLVKNFQTPFAFMGQAQNYRDLEALREAVRQVGDQIKKVGIPPPLRPLTVAVVGEGNVSKGAQELFNELPHQWVTREQMKDLVEKGNTDPYKVYGMVVGLDDYLEKKNGDKTVKIDFPHYLAHPHDYVSKFHEKVLPYASAIVNAMYWEKKYPRIITKEQMKEAVEKKKSRLEAISDISADPNGSIEFVTECTTIEDPFMVFDPVTGQATRGVEGMGVLITSVDNLPAELPLEATRHFGDMLMPYLEHYLQCPALDDGSTKSDVMRKATITESGHLTESYQYIQDLRGANRTTGQSIILFGSGMVAEPAVDYWARDKNITITIASIDKAEAAALVKGRTNVKTMTVDVNNMSHDSLECLVGSHSIAVSLLPATLHDRVARACVGSGRSLVTASYVSPQVKELDERAKQAGVTLMNEVGLDPGLDHILSLDLIDNVQRAGGKVTSFLSWCGGLPAPEASDNALGYKFSWSPRGALLAGLNDSVFKYKGKIIKIPGSRLYDSVDILPFDEECKGLSTEGLPNRNCLDYANLYNLGSPETLFRGTLRYSGYSAILKAMRNIGLMDLNTLPYLADDASEMSWRDLMMRITNASKFSSLEFSLLHRAKLDSEAERAAALQAFDSLGMLSANEMAARKGTLLDTLCDLLIKKLSYLPGERDMVYMKHILDVVYPDGKKETMTSTLIDYGTPVGEGYSAMAKTVGVPVAIATKLVLEGEITQKGVVVPMAPEIYKPMLALLKEEHICSKEKARPYGRLLNYHDDVSLYENELAPKDVEM